MLATLDYILIIIYALLILSIALWRRKKTSDDFLIAERKVGLLGTIATLNASKTGSIMLIFVAFLYVFGFAAMWYFIGVSIGYLLFIPFAKKVFRETRGTHFTLAEWVKKHWGNNAGKSASFLNIVGMVAWLLLNLVASSKVLSFFTGWSFAVSTGVVGVFVLAYLLFGGFKAVVTTDVIQYLAICIIIVIFVLYLLTGIAIPASEFTLTMSDKAAWIGFFIFGIIWPFSSPDVWQRMYAVKDEKTLKTGIIWSVVVYVSLAFLLALIGLAIKTQFPNVDPNIALIYGFTQLLPVGLVGLALVIFFAAFMSSIDTYAYTAAASLIHDFFPSSHKNMVKRIKWSLVGIILLASLAAIAVQDLVLGSFLFAGYFIILAIPILCSWRKKISTITMNITLIFSTLLLLLYTIYAVITQTLGTTIPVFAIVFTLISMGIGALVSKKYR